MTASDLDALASQFQDSEQALREAREKLEGLTRAEENVSASSAALSEASKRIDTFVEEAAKTLDSLQKVQAESARILEAGAQLLTGSDLAELKVEVKAAGEHFDTRMDSLEERVGAVESVEDEKRALQAELQHIKANVAPRHLKKALDSLPSRAD